MKIKGKWVILASAVVVAGQRRLDRAARHVQQQQPGRLRRTGAGGRQLASVVQYQFPSLGLSGFGPFVQKTVIGDLDGPEKPRVCDASVEVVHLFPRTGVI